jgi:hypothetical protein
MTERAEVLAIDWAKFDELCEERGWTSDPQRADGCGISYPMLRHLRTGYAGPGEQTIKRLTATFGDDKYDELIKRVPAPSEDVA